MRASSILLWQANWPGYRFPRNISLSEKFGDVNVGKLSIEQRSCGFCYVSFDNSEPFKVGMGMENGIWLWGVFSLQKNI